MSFTERFWTFADRHEVRRNAFGIVGLGVMAVGGYIAEHQPVLGGFPDVVIGLGLIANGALGLMGAGMQQTEVLAEREEQSRRSNLATMKTVRQEQPF